MLVVGSGTVPPRGGGNDKLNFAASSCEYGLICWRVSFRSLLGAGPGGQRQSRHCAFC